MIMAARLLLGALLFLCPAIAGEDKFIPPDLAHVTMLACVVGGHPDSVDAIAIAEYGSVRDRWEALVARRDRTALAMEDCIKWYGDVEAEFVKEAGRR